MHKFTCVCVYANVLWDKFWSGEAWYVPFLLSLLNSRYPRPCYSAIACVDFCRAVHVCVFVLHMCVRVHVCVCDCVHKISTIT